MGRGRRTPLDKRFWAKVARLGRDECWLWTGAINSDGYGVIRLPGDGDLVYAHRLSFAFVNGPIPDGLIILHQCDVRYQPGDITYRKCVNDRHLTSGTESTNIAEMWQKGRRPSKRWGEPKQLIIEGLA